LQSDDRSRRCYARYPRLATKPFQQIHGFRDGSLFRIAFHIAYLNAIWAYCRTPMVLASGDTPAGFGAVRRSNMLRGFRLTS
jgi:hypothetical protein